MLLINLILFAVFCWEYIGAESIYKPSVWLNYLATNTSLFFKYSGALFATVSSYLTLIDLDDLISAIYDLANSIYNIFVSPIYFIHGFNETANTYGDNYWEIYLGAGIIVVVCTYLLIKYYGTKIFKYVIDPIFQSICTYQTQIDKILDRWVDKHSYPTSHYKTTD